MKNMQLSLTRSPFDGTQLCITYDTEIFFPEPNELGKYSESDFDMAKSICNNCWMKDACLSFALQTNEKEGVWGGTTPAERRRIKRRVKK